MIFTASGGLVHRQRLLKIGPKVLGYWALFRLFPSASLLVAHLGLNPVRVRVRARVRVRVRGLG